MAGIEVMEEEDMLDKEEAQLPIITVVNKGIWLGTDLFPPMFYCNYFNAKDHIIKDYPRLIVKWKAKQ